MWFTRKNLYKFKKFILFEYFIYHRLLKSFLILKEKRLFYLQNRIYSSSKCSNFKRLFYYQVVFLTSLSTRFYVVKIILDAYPFSCSLGSLEKMNLALNLVNVISLSKKSLINIILKKKTRSFYNLTFFSVHTLCFSLLFTLSISPVLEAFSQNIYPDFNFYSNLSDFCFFLQEVLLNNKFLNFSLLTSISLTSSEFQSLGNRFSNLIPLPKRVLRNFFDFFSMETLSHFLFATFLEFLFLGLL